jgi:NADH:ubiquinone oxidoreductase subunit 2 (subunit N)
VGAFYYLRVIKIMLFDPPSDISFPINGARGERMLIAASAVYVSVLGFALIAPLNQITLTAAASLVR